MEWKEMAYEFKTRTNKKLEFARISVKEIVSRPKRGSADDFERCHEENFLFHLIGAKDSFLQEINIAYGLTLAISEVRESSLVRKLKQMEKQSPELCEIMDLEDRQKAGWLAIAIELRDQGTHRRDIGRTLEIGGELNGEVSFHNPISGQCMDIDSIKFFWLCLENMTGLLERLRSTLP
jgi:hypothetical protein